MQSLRLVSSGGRFTGLDLLEQPGDRQADEAEDREPAEDVDEGPESGLTSELLIEKALRRGEGVARAKGVGKRVAGVVDRILELLATEWDAVDDLVLVEGGP